MITFEEYKQSEWYDEVDYKNEKQEYISHVLPMLKKIERLALNSKEVMCFSLWETEYGDIDTDETDDDTLINIFSENGTHIDELYYYPSIDISFNVEDEFPDRYHSIIVDAIGRDFYDEQYYRFDDGELESCYQCIKDTLNAIVRIRATNAKTYMWKASSDDGAFVDKSSTAFATKEDCYKDMRNAVLEKIKWNTDYRDDFDDDDECTIDYNLSFSRNRIVHSSYSGIYTYEICESYEESAPRLIIDGYIKGSDRKEIKKLEDDLMCALQQAMAKFKAEHGSKVEELSMQGIQHLGI